MVAHTPRLSGLLLGLGSAALMGWLAAAGSGEAQQPVLPKEPKVTPVRPSVTPPRSTVPSSSRSSTSRRIGSSSKTAATTAPKVQEAAAAKAAYLLLATASNTYNGHKTRALHYVRSALGSLDRGSMGQMQPTILALQNRQAVLSSVVTVSGVDLGGAVSDAMVYNAGLMLSQLEPVLLANNQQSLARTVGRARSEVTAALEFSIAQTIKGREADVLTGAYILLAAANQDYNGHRDSAKAHVEAACNLLEHSLLTRGTVQKQIGALKDATAKNLVKAAAQTDAPVHEVQAYSDAQLLLADAIIQRVAFYLNPTSQRRVLTRLANADREIGLALLLH